MFGLSWAQQHCRFYQRRNFPFDSLISFSTSPIQQLIVESRSADSKFIARPGRADSIIHNTMEISFTQRVTIPPSVIVRTLDDGESVILHLDTEHYFGLDAIGTRMWTLLTTSESVETAYRTLLDEYDVEPEVLRRDVEAFVIQLAECKLVDIQPSDSSLSFFA